MNYVTFLGRLSAYLIGIISGLILRPILDEGVGVSIVTILIGLFLVLTLTTILELVLFKKQQAINSLGGE